MPDLVIEVHSGVDVRDGICQLAAHPSGGPCGMVRLEENIIVVAIARYLEQLVRDFLCLHKLPAADVKQPQAHQWRSEVYRALELPRNFASALESGADLRSRPTIDAHECRAELR